ncbi:hypothetical protein A0H81_12952 [Grifola frondosa]|uniref:Uncharacterized protein n=1 Tax=Grifola frondosa TaxID=5627 RepID=A0A1C7LRD6_GRIFR|nr:hypothetical protein A0H81_12952 [Grifola frondosa]
MVRTYRSLIRYKVHNCFATNIYQNINVQPPNCTSPTFRITEPFDLWQETFALFLPKAPHSCHSSEHRFA